MNFVLNCERRRRQLLEVDHVREGILTTIMGWLLGCFGKSKKRVRSIQTHRATYGRSKFPYGYEQPLQPKSPLRLRSGPLLQGDGGMKSDGRSVKSSCNNATPASQHSESHPKQNYMNRVHELEEELAKLRYKLLTESKEAQKLQNELQVNDPNTHGMQHSSDEQQKVCARNFEAEVLTENGHRTSKIKLQSCTRTSAAPVVCDPQQSMEKGCIKTTLNQTPSKLQKISSPSTEKSNLQSAKGTVVNSLYVCSSIGSASNEIENHAVSRDQIILSSEKQQATAVMNFGKDAKFSEHSKEMICTDGKQANKADSNVPQAFLSTQAWGLRYMWKQPLSPVRETDSVMSSEEDSCRQSGCSLSGSSSLSSKHLTQAKAESQRRLSDYLDQSILSILKSVSSEERYCEKVSSFLQLTSESDETTSQKALFPDELPCPSVDFNICDDDTFDMVPVQCPSPQLVVKSKRRSKTKRIVEDPNRKSLSSSPVSSSPSACEKENGISMDQDFFDPGIQDASNTWKISQTPVRSTSSILKPVENLSEWRKLKQSGRVLNVNESCNFDSSQQVHLNSGHFQNKDSQRSYTDSHCCNNLLRGDCMLQKQKGSTFSDQTNKIKDDADLDDCEQVDGGDFSCVDLGLPGNFCDFGVDFECLDLESSSAQLNQDTTNSAISRTFEDFEAACHANRAALLGEASNTFTEASEDTGVLQIDTISAESVIRVSPSYEHAVQTNPTERPIVGTVAAHWVCPGLPEPHWDGKGIPNSTTKYKEDQKVSWHATPFEVRLERALATEVEAPQRNLLRLMV